MCVCVCVRLFYQCRMFELHTATTQSVWCDSDNQSHLRSQSEANRLKTHIETERQRDIRYRSYRVFEQAIYDIHCV